MEHKYLICDVSILPECYAKVVEARSLVETGKAKDVSEAVRMIGKDNLYTLHVHDNDGKRDLHQLPHTGVINWDNFKISLKDINYSGVLSLETAINRKELSKTEWETKEIELANIAKKLAGII